MDNSTITTVVENKTTEKLINSSFFLLFAEFLGYTSPIVDWAEKQVKGEKISDNQKKIIQVDAIGIFNQMLKENLTKEDIRGWYDELYDYLESKYNFHDLPF